VSGAVENDDSRPASGENGDSADNQRSVGKDVGIALGAFPAARRMDGPSGLALGSATRE